MATTAHMYQHYSTALATTLSAMAGGLGKFFSSQPLPDLPTPAGLAEVGCYAAVSAVVGYGVKLGLDYALSRFKRPAK